MKSPTYLNVLVLIGLLVALFLNWSWPWGLLFIYWTVPALMHGEIFLIGPIDRDDRPVLFWFVAILWVLLGILMILVDAAPGLVADIYAVIWSF